MLWDYGDAAAVDERATVLFCVWLAGSCYRAVLPFRDWMMPSVVMGLDRALRRFDGAPTYALTDTRRPCRWIPCAGSLCVARRWWRSPGTTGSRPRRLCHSTRRARAARRATVRIARAHLVPTAHNLRPAY
jgi:hypothetical protein